MFPNNRTYKKWFEKNQDIRYEKFDKCSQRFRKREAISNAYGLLKFCIDLSKKVEKSMLTGNKILYKKESYEEAINLLYKIEISLILFD